MIEWPAEKGGLFWAPPPNGPWMPLEHEGGVHEDSGNSHLKFVMLKPGD